MTKPNQKLRLIMAILTSALLAAPSQVAFASEDSSLDKPCADLDVVFARGSGQEVGKLVRKNSDDEKVPTELAVLKKEVAYKAGGFSYNFYELGSENLKLGQRKYPAVSVKPYPAAYPLDNASNLLGASVGRGEFFSYGISVNIGVNEAAGYISQRLKKCPDTKFFLAGYSQGAQVISETFNKKLNPAQRDAVVFNALFGDPKLYLPEGVRMRENLLAKKELQRWRYNSYQGFGPSLREKPVIRPKLKPSEWRYRVPNQLTGKGSLGPRKPYLPEGWTSTTGLWCNSHDFVCGSTLNPRDNEGHFRYMEYHASYNEKDSLAKNANRKALSPIAEAVTVAFNKLSERSGDKPYSYVESANRTSGEAATSNEYGEESQKQETTSEDSLPLAWLPLDAYYVSSNEEAEFDAAYPYVDNSDIVKWEWDFDGDGTFDFESTESVAKHTYPTSGDFTLTVRATNNKGLTGTLSVPIHVDTTTGLPILPDPATSISATRISEDEVELRWEADKEPSKGWLIRSDGFPLGYTLPEARSIIVEDIPLDEEVELGVSPIAGDWTIGETISTPLQRLTDIHSDPQEESSTQVPGASSVSSSKEGSGPNYFWTIFVVIIPFLFFIPDSLRLPFPWLRK